MCVLVSKGLLSVVLAVLRDNFRLLAHGVGVGGGQGRGSPAGTAWGSGDIVFRGGFTVPEINLI